MKNAIFAVIVFLASEFTVRAQMAAPAADVIKAACSDAGNSGKNVMVIFHASWCVWCHKMDSSMADPSCSKFFNDNYVITHLVVDETDNKKNLENPGASAYRDAQGGKDQGIPYWLILDKSGNVLANSRMPDGDKNNTGCPAAENEVNYFTQVLKKTSHMTDADMAAVKKRFLRNQ
jgi:thioredoxin-related protein